MTINLGLAGEIDSTQKAVIFKRALLLAESSLGANRSLEIADRCETFRVTTSGFYISAPPIDRSREICLEILTNNACGDCWIILDESYYCYDCLTGRFDLKGIGNLRRIYDYGRNSRGYYSGSIGIAKPSHFCCNRPQRDWTIRVSYRGGYDLESEDIECQKIKAGIEAIAEVYSSPQMQGVREIDVEDDIKVVYHGVDRVRQSTIADLLQFFYKYRPNCLSIGVL